MLCLGARLAPRRAGLRAVAAVICHDGSTFLLCSVFLREAEVPVDQRPVPHRAPLGSPRRHFPSALRFRSTSKTPFLSLYLACAVHARLASSRSISQTRRSSSRASLCERFVKSKFLMPTSKYCMGRGPLPHRPVPAACPVPVCVLSVFRLRARHLMAEDGGAVCSTSCLR